VNTVARGFRFDVNTVRYRPIKGGIGITNRVIGLNEAGTGTKLEAGTLGCIGMANDSGDPVLLSNWHVLKAFDPLPQARIYQPFPLHLPDLDPADLPLHPNRDDENDAIGRILRHAITTRVDAAVARIDVSSCCGCTGIKFEKVIEGLSENGRPPRNTMVGRQPAVAGMTVFKVGISTYRTEGRVLDPTYPPFDIPFQGQTYHFENQIAIEPFPLTTDPFTLQGDSGAAIINLENKIVGLHFASSNDVLAEEYLSVANHIGDVLTALNIDILYRTTIISTAGPVLADVDLFEPESVRILEPYRALYARMMERPGTASLYHLVSGHRAELMTLVSRARPVTVAWHRNRGPAFLAAILSAIRDGREDLPLTIKGQDLAAGLERMQVALMGRTSPALTAALRTHGPALLEAARKSRTFEELFAYCDAAMRHREPA
jgi:hypothetical protein